MSTKHFLYALFGGATVVWAAIYFAFGPAGPSAAYLEEYGAEHDHYLELIKSDPVKAYFERPALHGFDAPHAPHNLREQIEFVEAYEARPAFQAEEARRARFSYLFEFFNAGIVVVLIVALARKPIAAFLDQGAREIHDKIDTVHTRRAEAEARLDAAKKQFETLADEERQVGEETEQRLWNELAELAKANQHSLNEMIKAAEDRKQAEIVAAERRMKRELIDAGIAAFVQRYEANADAQTQAELVDTFAAQVREMKA